jgi:nucleotide-binding universal stress UspA family protein
MEQESQHYRIARDDFRRARRMAALKQIEARLRRKPTELLPFEEVRQILKASGEEQRGLQTIPLDAIVGSVGRYTDFTRDFLPRRDTIATRWVRLRASVREKGLLRPIQVYQIGEVYFVLDGNHRVSVFRERGAHEIQAYVTEIPTKIKITPETDLDGLILKVETTDFLEKSRLDENCPKVDLTITAPGQYQILEGQIELLRQQTEEQKNISVSFVEAAQIWCRESYAPVAKTMRQRGILRDFPNRTETDLYVWILKHQKRLQQELGWRLEPTVVATDIADQHSNRPSQVIARVTGRVRAKLVPEFLKTGPRPGKFRARQEKIHAHDPAHLFTHMLVPLSGEAESWQALELGLRLAWREEAHLLGLHVVPKDKDRFSPKVEKIRHRFEKECQDVGLPGELAVKAGSIVRTICKHARLSDLVLIHLAHPPEEHPIMRTESGIRRLIQQSPRPILTIPRVPEKLERLLVAYNGNPRSREALYAAAYFASRWEVPLFVLTVNEPGKIKPKIINHARYYLRSRRIPATFIQKKGRISETILETREEQECNFIFMGGYSKPPVIDVVLGSPLDKVLRESPVPVLICR